MALHSLARNLEGDDDRTNGYIDGGSSGKRWVEWTGGEGADRMEGDTELEEGEALERRPEVFDLDKRLSYLDTKLEAVLGHCQKEFQGNIFSDKLGSRYGGYGTFLPTQARGASVLPGLLPAPVSDRTRMRLTEGQPERARRIQGSGSGAAPDRVPKVSPSDAGIKNHIQVNGENHWVDVVANVSLKSHTPRDDVFLKKKKLRVLTLQSNLQGQGIDKGGKKAVAVELNLNHSSSPSVDEDPDDSILASENEVSPDRSPLDMIRIMTSYQRPLGRLLSPLHPEPLDWKAKPVVGMKLNRIAAAGSSVIRAEWAAVSRGRKIDSSTAGDGMVSKEKKEKAYEKVKGTPLEVFDTAHSLDAANLPKKDMETDQRVSKEGGSDSMKGSYKFPVSVLSKEMDLQAENADKHFSNDVFGPGSNDIDSSKDTTRNPRKEVTLASMREDGTGFLCRETRDFHKLMEDPVKDATNPREPSLESNLKESVAKEVWKEKREPGGIKDALKARREKEERVELNSWRDEDLQMEEDTQREIEPWSENEVAFGNTVLDERNGRSGERSRKTLALAELKKKNNENSKAILVQKEVRETVNDAKKEASKENKRDSFKKAIILSEVLGGGKDEPKEQLKPVARDFSKESLKDVGKEAGSDESLKEEKTRRKGGKRVRKELKSVKKEKSIEIRLSRAIPGSAGDTGWTQSIVPQHFHPQVAGSSAETPAAAALPAGRLVLDNWVLCDRCQQWRLILPEIDPELLPDKWQCKMMTWLPGYNSCKHPEEFTTAAVFNYLGLQYPATTHGVQAQQPLLDPAFAPPSQQMLDTRLANVKPIKVQRFTSKKGLGKRTGGGTAKLSTTNLKIMEVGSVKSKSLNDVVQHPADVVVDSPVKDMSYIQAIANKQKPKEKEKVKRMRPSQGDDMRPQKETAREEEPNQASGSWQDQEWGQPETLQAQLQKEANGFGNSMDPDLCKQLKGKYLQDADKEDSVEAKRRKKSVAPDEHELLLGKKSSGEESRGWKATEVTTGCRAQEDGDIHPMQYLSDGGGGQEGESRDRAHGNSRYGARGVPLGLPLKSVKMASAQRDTKNTFKQEDGQDTWTDERHVKDNLNLLDVKSTGKALGNHESDNSNEDEKHKDVRICIGDREVSRRAEFKERDGLLNGRKRLKGDYPGCGHPAEKMRMVLKNELKDLGAPQESMREGQVKKIEQVEQDSRAAILLKNVKDDIKIGQTASLFDEVSGIACAYAQQSHQERVGESPNGDNSVFQRKTVNQLVQKGERSLSSSSSKVSYSAGFSAFGSKGASPIESTVSSSPLRSSKIDAAATGRTANDFVQTNGMAHRHHLSENLNSVSLTPKRSLDQDADALCDGEEALQCCHRSWDDRHLLSDSGQKFMGFGKDGPRDRSSGRAQDDQHPATDSSGGVDFRKDDVARNCHDDECSLEVGWETRAGSATDFLERSDRQYEDNCRGREDFADRCRERENRYEKRGRHEELFRVRDGDRDRDCSKTWESWPKDRRVEEKTSRERSERQDWGRPSSHEHCLDNKHETLNWHKELRQGRDVLEGRDRLDDENAENEHNLRANPLDGTRIELSAEDVSEAVPNLHRDDSGRRSKDKEPGLQKNAKAHFLPSVPTSGQEVYACDGDKLASGRRDLDASTHGNGFEGVRMTTSVTSRGRADGQQGGLGSRGVRGKSGLLDYASHDVRIVEGGKQGKERNMGADDNPPVRLSVAKTTGSSGYSSRSVEGITATHTQKDPAQFAQGLMREAKDLKHTADRLKCSAATEGESTNLYLQAALKFLQGAHYLEIAPFEGVRQGETTQYMLVYTDTAKLFDFCAAAYERQKDLPAAALAHICAAVARIRVAMCKFGSVSKDFLELHSTVSSAVAPGTQGAAVQTPPTNIPLTSQPARALERLISTTGVGATSAIGESPSSSSASDVDNLNSHAAASDKGLSANSEKGTPQVLIPSSTSGGTDLIPQRYPNFHRVIRNGLDMCGMLESWTKAQSATAMAEAACVGFPCRTEGMLAVRRVGEISFLGSMDAVVRQVRLALEAIGH